MDLADIKMVSLYSVNTKLALIPMIFKNINKYYYDLSKKEDIERQADLAEKYGISGFIFYHYWFGNDRQIFPKPVEIFKNDEKGIIPILRNRDRRMLSLCFYSRKERKSIK